VPGRARAHAAAMRFFMPFDGARAADRVMVRAKG